MKKYLGVAVGAFGIVLAVAAGTAHARGNMDLAKAHVEVAKEIAGDDLKMMLANCSDLGSDYMIPDDHLHPLLKKVIGLGGLPAFQAFDNLYFVGTKWVSSWAVKTFDGIILIGALNNKQEVKNFIEPGLRKFGMDPASIEKVIIAHGHGDHYGGAKYIHETYGSEIIMSKVAWNVLDKRPLQYDDKLWGRPPEKGMAVIDGDKITLGDTTLTVLLTPGHTPGTISLLIPLKDGGETHKAILWGGNGFNFGRKPKRFLSYIKSTKRIANLAEAGIDVFLSNHSSLDGTRKYLEELKSRSKGDQNPYVIGVDGVQRAMAVLRQCSLANLASFAVESMPGRH